MPQCQEKEFLYIDEALFDLIRSSETCAVNYETKFILLIKDRRQTHLVIQLLKYFKRGISRTHPHLNIKASAKIRLRQRKLDDAYNEI